jgi:tetratricopeptide (TPR) repeat protein
MIDWHEHYEAGKLAFDDNNYEVAVDHLEAVIKEKESFADVYNMLGIIYFDANRRDEAIGVFEKAIKINPGYIDAYLNLSVVYNEMGEFDKGQGVYLKAKEAEGATLEDKANDKNYLDPYVKGKITNMHAEIGNIYRDLGLNTEACLEYQKALKLSPGFVDIKTNLAISYRNTKDFSKAIRELEEAASLNPDFRPVRVQLGLTYYMMGKKDLAKAEWLKVLRKFPNDKLARMYMNLVAD